jgi:hypothetical protein
MIADIKELDAHEQPSEELKAKWKAYSKTEQKELIESEEIDDLECAEKTGEFCLAGSIPAERLHTSFKHITPPGSTPFQVEKDAPIYYHPLLPGEFSHTFSHNTQLTQTQASSSSLQSSPPRSKRSSSDISSTAT